ncbi:MAG: DNA recombination protein RmuC [Phycisphaerales bacterium]|nr:DNA recombination protein RmuC [Phycisphaerales bacterium]
MDPLIATLILVAGSAAGFFGGWILASRRAAALEMELIAAQEALRSEQSKVDEQRAFLEKSEQRLRDAFSALSTSALQQNNALFMQTAAGVFTTLRASASGDLEARKKEIEGLVAPLTKLVDEQKRAMAEMELKREGAYGGLIERVQQLALSNDAMQAATAQLNSAMRRSDVRGRWGELALARLLEISGMTNRCDFTQQSQSAAVEDRGALRPDMTIHIPGGGTIVVDSKLPFASYLELVDPACTPEKKVELIAAHCGAVRMHVRALASKEYWKLFTPSPQLVVMFVELESALHTALEHDRDLFSDAMGKHVLLAGPTNLMSLLLTISENWRQEQAHENHERILTGSKVLCERVNTFLEHMAAVGTGLKKAQESYNRAVGSLEGSIRPQMRKMHELGVAGDEIIEVPPIETTQRELGP